MIGETIVVDMVTDLILKYEAEYAEATRRLSTNLDQTLYIALNAFKITMGAVISDLKDAEKKYYEQYN